MDTLVYGDCMLFHDFLEVLLGSKVKLRVLRTLWRYRGKEFTVRELARFLNLSHMGVRKVLRDLEGMNVIRIVAVGRSHTIRLNVDSYAGGIVEEIFKLEDGILEELTSLLRKGLGRAEVVSAAIFGSVVEKKERPLSDIDLLIVTDRREKVEEVVSKLQGQVATRFGNTLSSHYLSEREFKEKRGMLLIKRIMENHVLILGKPLR